MLTDTDPYRPAARAHRETGAPSTWTAWTPLPGGGELALADHQTLTQRMAAQLPDDVPVTWRED
jgi:hypothetical protein